MNWIPRNKKTGIEYPAIPDAEKAQWESDPNLKGKYTYKATGEAAKIKSPNLKPSPKNPVGVPPPQEIPNEPKEEETTG